MLRSVRVGLRPPAGPMPDDGERALEGIAAGVPTHFPWHLEPTTSSHWILGSAATACATRAQIEFSVSPESNLAMLANREFDRVFKGATPVGKSLRNWLLYLARLYGRELVIFGVGPVSLAITSLLQGQPLYLLPAAGIAVALAWSGRQRLPRGQSQPCRGGPAGIRSTLPGFHAIATCHDGTTT